MAIGLLQKPISLAQLQSWGALGLYEERLAVRRMMNRADQRSGCAPAEHGTSLAEMLAGGSELNRILWVVTRPGITPDSVLHQFGLDVAEEGLRRLRREGTYLDIRLSQALRTKQEWVDGDIPWSEVEYMDDHVSQAESVALEFCETRSILGAQLVREAISEVAERTVRCTCGVYYDLFPGDQTEATLREKLRTLLLAA